MTEKRLEELNRCQTIIQNFSKIQNDIENNRWVQFRTPCHEVSLPLCTYIAFKGFLRTQIELAKKELEEAPE